MDEKIPIPDPPDKVDVWWGRLLNQPMAVCLIVSILGNIAQMRMASSAAMDYRKEMQEIRQEIGRERAAVDLANKERDRAQQQAITAKDESIRAKDVAIEELQRRH